jgi:hypothetical protein
MIRDGLLETTASQGNVGSYQVLGPGRKASFSVAEVHPATQLFSPDRAIDSRFRGPLIEDAFPYRLGRGGQRARDLTQGDELGPPSTPTSASTLGKGSPGGRAARNTRLDITLRRFGALSNDAHTNNSAVVTDPLATWKSTNEAFDTLGVRPMT